jgi:anti-anti-sigma regulatory factor
MLLIAPPRCDEQTVTLRLEGQLTGPWVAELRDATGKFLGNGHRLVLDLTDVTFADPGGVGLLNELQAQRVELAGASPFLQEQLKIKPM